MTDADLERAFVEHRRYLLGVAYRLLGTVSEAEDAVQEAWVRARTAARDDVDDVRAWLAVITTRICLDVLKSARVRRERYVGQWLPEPFVDAHPAHPADPADRVTLDESVSTALLVVLETLSPAERTAFVLHDVFGLPFDTIAEAVGRSPAACRQLAVRARAHVETRAPRFDADRDERRRVVTAFTQATATGDLDALLRVLDPAVVLRADGGGKVPSSRRPIVSADAVATVLVRSMRRWPETVLTTAVVNGGPGVVATFDGRVTGVMTVAIADGRVTELDLVMNPDKLRHVPVPAPPPPR